MQAYPIQRTLWESIDAILFAKGVSLARDIAMELNISPQALIASLNMQERGKFTIIPDDETNQYQCQALVQTGSVYMRCRHPTLTPAPSLCNAHIRSTVDAPLGLPLVTRVIDSSSGNTYVTKNNEVFTLNGAHCGILKGSKLTVFEIEE
jgi:hypothetical protein